MKNTIKQMQARRAMRLYNKHVAGRYQTMEREVISGMREVDQMVHSFLSDPSVREIARALNVPKSTVHLAIQRLRSKGLGRGVWKLEGRS